MFTNSDPNGSWQLFIVDDGGGNVGRLERGWALQITAEIDVQINERVKIKRKKQR